MSGQFLTDAGSLSGQFLMDLDSLSGQFLTDADSLSRQFLTDAGFLDVIPNTKASPRNNFLQTILSRKADYRMKLGYEITLPPKI